MIRFKNILYCVACVALLFLAGCGEYFAQEWPEGFDPENQPEVTGLGLDTARPFVLYVGDEFKLNPQVGDKLLDQLDKNDQEIAISHFFASTKCGDSIVCVRQTDIKAIGVGNDTIRFSNFSGNWNIKLRVSVLPGWNNMPGWRYETIVYANVTVDDETPDSGMMFAAFCKDELRGRGVTRTVKGITYTVFRIGSNTNKKETIHFMGYDPANSCYITFEETITFDGATHGTLSDLFELKGKK